MIKNLSDSQEYHRWSDIELLKGYLNDPESIEGRTTKEILEYRKHQTLVRHNAYLLWLTVVLALTGIAQILVAIFA
jgi:hypothetical protein